MNIKLFLFSNLIFISKINCIDLNKIEVFLDDKKVTTGDYIEIDDSKDAKLDVSLVDDKEVSISKIEVQLQDDSILNFIDIRKFIDYLNDKKGFKKIKFYLVSRENCCEKFYIKIGKKSDFFNYIPFEIIVYFYKIFAKDINNKALNVDIFRSYNGGEHTTIKDYVDIAASGYQFSCKNSWELATLYITDILIKTKDNKKKSIIEKDDDDEKIIGKLEKLKNCNIYFIVELQKNIDIHINFDDITYKDEYKVRESPLETQISHNIYYYNEFYKKKGIKLEGKTIDKYKLLFKELPNLFEFIKVKNKYKKDEFVEKIRNDIKNYVKNVCENIVFDIDEFFPKEKIKVYKKEEYLNNNEQKAEIVNNEDIYCDEVFVEFKAEDIIRFYSIFPRTYTEETKINVKFETSNENLKDKNLKFEYHDLLSDYLKENIFCQKDFEFVKDINNYKVIYQNKEYNPGEHIEIDPKISKDIIFKILEKDEDINKKIKDQEDKKQAVIVQIKAELNNLKSSITNEMTSNKLREELNKIINSTTIEDQECKNLINEINVKITEKVQKELKSTTDVLQKHKLVNDALKDLLNNSKEKNATDLQTSLNNILQNGYNPDEENKKLIDQVKSEIQVKENSKKDNQQITTDDTNQEDNTKQTKKPCCCYTKCKSAKCKSNK